MQRTDFLSNLKSPLPNAVLEKWPQGNVMQFWGENPALYSASKPDDLHTFLGGHTGVDIATGHRDPVYAAHDGHVPSDMIFDNPTRAGGREVWVYSPSLDGETPDNSQVCTVYCHLDEIVAKPGQQVKQGDLLGYEGNTGFVVSGNTQFWGNAPAGVGTHLHFGLYELILRGGLWVRRTINVLNGSSDPLPYISKTPQRPNGNLSGFTVVLNNAAALLNKWRRK
jgi:murein DD-endopeptidase MepM/ murein hydrolase activator NlpD